MAIFPARYWRDDSILGSQVPIHASGCAFEQSWPSSHRPGMTSAKAGIVPVASAVRSGPEAGVPIATSLTRQDARSAGKYTAGLCLAA